MKVVRIAAVILLVAGFLSCNKKKKYPDSVIDTESVFYFKALVDNSPISFGAGINNYYMYASYRKDLNNLFNYSGDLKQTGCAANCPNSIGIRIRAGKSYSISIADSALTPKPYVFADAIPGYQVVFKAGYNKTAASYDWDFGDGSGSSQANPVHVYATGGIYNVCLTIKSTNGCLSSVCNLQKIGLPGTPCKTMVGTDSVVGNTVYFKQVSTGLAPFKFLWEFGDGTRDISLNPSHTYTVAGGHPVSLRVTDASNNVAYTIYNAVTEFDQSSCATNYTVVSETPFSAVNLNVADVGIYWTDASGTVFSSEKVAQPASTYFQILSVENYGTNENGQKIKKIHAKFKCNVSDGGRVITLDNAEAVIAVAYE